MQRHIAAAYKCTHCRKHVIDGLKPYPACDAPKIGICDFGPFSETYFAEILGGTKKLPLHDTLQTSSFQMV